MSIRAVLALVVLTAALIPTTSAAAPTDGQVDISGAEVAGSQGGIEINVFGTVRCAAAGPFQIDVALSQSSTGGIAAGGSNGFTCPAAGDLSKWVVTALGETPFVVGDKVTITAIAAGSTIATDTEDHVLRCGR